MHQEVAQGGHFRLERHVDEIDQPQQDEQAGPILGLETRETLQVEVGGPTDLTTALQDRQEENEPAQDEEDVQRVAEDRPQNPLVQAVTARGDDARDTEEMKDDDTDEREGSQPVECRYPALSVRGVPFSPNAR